MSVIARCEYGKTCQLLVQLFNNAAQSYQEMISNMGTSKIDISVQEGKLIFQVEHKLVSKIQTHNPKSDIIFNP
jgi:exportin-7